MSFLYLTLVIFSILYSRWIISVYWENKVNPFNSYGWEGVALFSGIYAVLYAVVSVGTAAIILTVVEYVGEFL